MRRYWVIAPQHANPRERWERAWRYDLANNSISIGGGRVGDISSLSKKQVSRLIDRKRKNNGLRSKSYYCRLVWNFYHSVKRGDVIIASQGRHKIAAIGTVTRKAYYEHNKNAQAVPDDPYSHHLGVRWEKEPRGKSIGTNLARIAFYEIPEQKFLALMRSEPGKLPTKKRDERGTSLPAFDESERVAAVKAQTVFYRNRHNKMTNALKLLWKGYKLRCGNLPDCRYDVLIENYDDRGRDLLIEAKPDPEKGAIRIALGQLFDYRRFLPHRIRTDLSVLTISRPPKLYTDLLMDLQISALWFQNEGCETLRGQGKAWEALPSQLKV
jgi:hypothetical protein